MADHISISHCDVQVVAKPISSYQHIRKVRLVEPKKALAAGPSRSSNRIISYFPAEKNIGRLKWGENVDKELRMKTMIQYWIVFKKNFGQIIIPQIVSFLKLGLVIASFPTEARTYTKLKVDYRRR